MELYPLTDELLHYGTPRHSGRYPWGSGENPYQHEEGWLARVNELRKQGLSDTEIARGMNLSTTQFRAYNSIAKADVRAAQRTRAIELKDKGYSNVKIGEILGIQESSVRNLLDPVLAERSDKNRATAEQLKSQLESKRFIDVGKGTELDMGVTSTRLKTSLEMLKAEGYKVYYIQVEQMGTGHKTSIEVLCPPGTTYNDVKEHMEDIKTFTDYSPDGGSTWWTPQKPSSISSDRVQIRYNEEGGVEKDGVIELRRGVDELSLGASNYAQVRIAVDGTHYLKGMAVYSDNMPEGVDIIFNTNKHVGTDKMDVLKELKKNKATNEIDWDNPFGATIKAEGQRDYISENGEKKLSPVNIVNEEGDWNKWSRNLASQMLSKQSVSLASKQLNAAYTSREAEYDDIISLTNPTLRKQLLLSFAESCDSAAVNLKAAALPGQSSHVILPVPEMKDNEIYAPKLANGTEVCLIRYPHGGTFEIPQLTVNNKQKDAKKLLGNAVDAVGINSHVAERLSGADFDGDTVLVIPLSDKVKIKTTPRLEGLKNFDPKELYPLSKEQIAAGGVIKSQTKQTEMGKVSNLITDMTLKGATQDEIARAVRHSMVVIDAEKHKLDWKRSEKENGINELKKKYQGSSTGGASTLISRAKSDVRVPQRDPNKTRIDPKTGEKLYFETGESYTKTWVLKNGETRSKTIQRQDKSTQMAETKDATTLISDWNTPMEKAYAKYANQCKALANKARKEALSTKDKLYSPEAAKTYAPEVQSLNNKLLLALKNAPKERQAQIISNVNVNAKKAANPDMSKDELKKIKNQELAKARVRVGAKKTAIEITDREWEAIQSGAIHKTTLEDIFMNTNQDKLKELAMPREQKELSDAKKAHIRALLNSGYTISEVANQMGVSASTVTKYSK